MFEHALCEGVVSHCRHHPRHHQFSYPVSMPLVNLQKSKELDELSSLMSTKNRWSLYRFCEDDYLREHRVASESLYQRAKRLVEDYSEQPFSGTIMMLANWRVLGMVFNPIALFYFYDDEGQLSYLMSEVSNTPWNQRHLYWHTLSDSDTTLKATTDKAFHVSPYNPMAMEYQWHAHIDIKKVTLKLSLFANQTKHFDAAMSLCRQKMDKKQFYRMISRRPLLSLQTLFRIYWQALKLFVKRIPLYTHPGYK
ncbi:DUF1365 family protein [Pleionea sp. CnH1-48]|uniref:DUF1365 domain-containing protein n=1 Tax=Pleionea sp. CnH1-48 TaxID=2954494 RepID=UPI0020969A44|nr:DUF1365 domain-containing protein [Pleionea sp. CnH1-48]